MRIFTVFACSTFCALLPILGIAANDSESVTLERTTEVPGATLQAGQFRFEVEDRLQDRAIVRITGQDGSSHELVLSVPNDKLPAASSGNIVFFPAGDPAKQTVQAWKCPSCAAPLEFVYPKDQAVAVTQSTGKPVMAVDPSYDKLPKNLSADDMKVVTLWLLAPKQITADGKGAGVEPTKYADLKAGETPAVAAAPATTPSSPAAASPANATPAVPPVAATSASVPSAPADPVAAPAQVATSSEPKMPHTAGHDSDFAAAGLLLLASSAILFWYRGSRARFGAEGNR